MDSLRPKKWALNPGKFQSNLFRKLIKSGSKTQFGRDHQFDEIRNHTDFTQRVPIRDYEELKPYINEILKGKKRCSLARSTCLFSQNLWDN